MERTGENQKRPPASLDALPKTCFTDFIHSPPATVGEPLKAAESGLESLNAKHLNQSTDPRVPPIETLHRCGQIRDTHIRDIQTGDTASKSLYA